MVLEKVRIQNRRQADLQSAAPGLVDLAGSVDNLWYLHFLTARPSLRQLAAMRPESLLKSKGVGKSYAAVISTWQKRSRTAWQVNTRNKAAMMVAVAHHAWKVAESHRYYEKKQAEGKKHNQALRSLGRHRVRVIWSLARDHRRYETR